MMKRLLLLVSLAGVGALSAFFIQAWRQSAATSRRADSGASDEKSPTRALKTTSPGESSPPRAPLTPASLAAKNDDTIASTDPRSKDYDPVVVNRTLDISPVNLFDKEPRDPAFAGPREQALQARIDERLRARVKFPAKVDVNCRTSSCELSLEGGQTAEDLDSALQALDLHLISETTTIGPLRHTSEVSRKGLSIVILYSAALRDHFAYEQLLRQHKERDDLPPR